MPLIKLRQTNDTGEEAGDLYVNTDQIVVIVAGRNATEILTADGRTHWVKETPAEVAAAMKTNS